MPILPVGWPLSPALQAGWAALRDELVGSNIGISILVPGSVRSRVLQANASRSPDNSSVAIGTERFRLSPNRDLGDWIDTRVADMKKSFRSPATRRACIA